MASFRMKKYHRNESGWRRKMRNEKKIDEMAIRGKNKTRRNKIIL